MSFKLTQSDKSLWFLNMTLGIANKMFQTRSAPVWINPLLRKSLIKIRLWPAGKRDTLEPC